MCSVVSDCCKVVSASNIRLCCSVGEKAGAFLQVSEQQGDSADGGKVAGV